MTRMLIYSITFVNKGRLLYRADSNFGLDVLIVDTSKSTE